MLMYATDNEQHNCQTVSTLGVHCVYTPRGMTEVLSCVRVCVRASASEGAEGARSYPQQTRARAG